MMKRIVIVAVTLFAAVQISWAGGWDTNKGLSTTTLKGKLVCVGCSLKKLDGANAQCNLFAHHAIGFKSADGTYWSIIDNAIGHDVIRAHELIEGKDATINGWIYPIANMVEIDKIEITGVSHEQVAKAGWDEDQEIAKSLLARKIGEAPASSTDH